MTAAWMVYSTTRARWQNGDFRKRFPDEPTYRHSLAEEMDAFEQMLVFADNEELQGRPLTDPQIPTIRGLRSRGLLEAFLLLHAPDAGIARDFEKYRAGNRAKLQAYVESMIIAPQR